MLFNLGGSTTAEYGLVPSGDSSPDSPYGLIHERCSPLEGALFSFAVGILVFH